MCRFLAYAAPVERTLAEAVGPHAVQSFRALSCLHGDGWGMAWADSDSGEPRLQRSTVSAAEDPAFERATESVRARAGFLHLRWATTGIAVGLDNTHPFRGDGWAFAHNGFVHGADAIEQLLDTRNRQALTGRTDSERYFRLVLQCADRSGDMLSGLQTAAETIRQLSGCVSLNALLLSADRLLAVHGLQGAAPPIEDMLEVFPNTDDLPLDHARAYFQLSYRQVGETVIITSSGIPNEGWTAQPPNTVLDVSLDSRTCRTHPLLSDSAPESVDDAPTVARQRRS